MSPSPPFHGTVSAAAGVAVRDEWRGRERKRRQCFLPGFAVAVKTGTCGTNSNRTTYFPSRRSFRCKNKIYPSTPPSKQTQQVMQSQRQTPGKLGLLLMSLLFLLLHKLGSLLHLLVRMFPSSSFFPDRLIQDEGREKEEMPVTQSLSLTYSHVGQEKGGREGEKDQAVSRMCRRRLPVSLL